MKKYYTRFCEILMFVLLQVLLQVPSFAQNINKPVIHLKNQELSYLDNPADWLNKYTNRAEQAIPQQVIISFLSLPTAIEKAELQAHGIELLNYIPDNGYTALIYPNVSTGIANMYNIQGIADIQDLWKVDNAMAKKITKEYYKNLEVTISFIETVTREEIKEHITEFGGIIINDNLSTLGIYDVEIQASKLQRLLSWYAVVYANLRGKEVPLDISAVATQKANLLWLPQYVGGYGLSGHGVTIGVGDNTSAIFHTDLKDRVINYNPVAEETHGLHTAGLAAGAGIIDPEARGVAPAATIVSQFYSGIWEEAPAYYKSHNMTITNNSYALAIQDCDIAGTYDNHSMAIDRYAIDYDKVLHVFAGGNDGNLLCEPFPLGFGTVSGGYQPSKNNLVVSSIDRFYLNREVTSASGPVKDGRLKPEISAVGAYVYSCDVNDSYVSTLGTSQASPQVVGGLALLTERYKQLNNGDYPTNLLLKGLALNGATDVGNPGPDFTNGFGALNLFRSLRILENKRYFTGNVHHNAQEQFTINVPANTTRLKVMLGWNDPAASPMAAKVLVNDLDIEVITPAGNMHRPLVLDPSPAGVKDIAIERVDRLNNTEQVVIDKPQVGNYTITVRGFSVPSGEQDFLVTYDFLPDSLVLTHPTAGTAVKADDTVFVYWEAPIGNSTFSLEYSTNDGAAWNLLDDNIPAEQRYYMWLVPNISSGDCRIRLRRNDNQGEVLSGKFAVNSQPLVELDSIQCPGYIRINWNIIGNATAYEVSRKKGVAMVPVDTVTGTTYTFAGLSIDSAYFVAVRPMFSNIPGFRSLAVRRIPSDGSCEGSISDNDLVIESILSPASGRKYTSTALYAHDTIAVVVRNLDDVLHTAFKLSYSINGASWQSKIYSYTLLPNTPNVLHFDDVDLSFFKHYDIRVAIENLESTDPVKNNDTLAKHVVSLNNDFINIQTTSFVDSFEDMPAILLFNDSMGISANEHWDYFKTNYGRLRVTDNENIVINGKHSISLDAIQNSSLSNSNMLTGTFNIPAMGFIETRLEFSYLVHGVPRNSGANGVWFRPSDMVDSKNIFRFKTDIYNIGKVQRSGSISLTDAMTGSSVGSTSAQIIFQQDDTSVISLKNFGNGITIDDVKIYSVVNDIQLSFVINPEQQECGLSGEMPLTVQLHNGVNYPLHNVRVFYRLNNGITVSEMIPSIPAKKDMLFTFSNKMKIIKGDNKLDTWVVVNGDTYNENDSILNYTIHNQPVINVFPYFEDFEAGNGYWYTDGVLTSWEYGRPASPGIKSAASGTKVWMTNLDGNYNNLETSYLYSPCIDVTALRQPILRLKNAVDIENCGDVLCDEAHIEYSQDNINWKKLGTANDGKNWYNNPNYNIWSEENRFNWVQSMIKLPADLKTFRLRFVFNSDIGVTKEGIAVDDIEIFDYEQLSQLIKVYPNPAINGTFTLKWSATAGTVMNLSITDVLGKNVYNTSQTAITNAYHETTVSLPQVSSGVYFLKCIIGDKEYQEKVVIR